MLALKWPIGADPALDIPPFPRDDEDLDLDVPPPPRSWRASGNDSIAPIRPDEDAALAIKGEDPPRWIADAAVRPDPPDVSVSEGSVADSWDTPTIPQPGEPKPGEYYAFSTDDDAQSPEIEVPRSYDRVERDYYGALSQDREATSSDEIVVPESHDRVERDYYGPLSRDRHIGAGDDAGFAVSDDNDAGRDAAFEVPISHDRAEQEYEVPISYDRVPSHDPSIDVPISYDRVETEYEVPISYDRVEQEYDFGMSDDRIERPVDVPISHDRVEKEHDFGMSYDRAERPVEVPISYDRAEREIDVPVSRDRVERQIEVPISYDRVEREIDVPISRDRVDRSGDPKMVPLSGTPGQDRKPKAEFIDQDEAGFSDEGLTDTYQPDTYDIDVGTTFNPHEDLERGLLDGSVSSHMEAIEFGSEVAAILAEMVTADAGEAALSDSIRLRFTSWLDCATDTITTHVVDPCLRNRDGTETPFHGLLSSGPSPERSLSIDCIMVEQLKQSIPPLLADGTKIDLCLPVAASTLLRPKFRSQYMALWSDMDDVLRRSLRLNAYGLPAGAASQSGDLFSWMRSLTGRAPNVRIPPRVELMAPLGGFAVHAVAINYEKWFDELGPHLFVETLLRLIKQARQHRVRVALTKLPDIRAIRIGFAAGVDFLELSQLDAPADLPRRPIKINRAVLTGATKPAAR
jgi:hypothetical protein